MTDFNWQNPDYTPLIKQRMRRLQRIREQPELIGHLKRVYRDQPWLFITDWGTTSDPRHVEIGLPVTIPFILFPRQIEWCKWLYERWRAREPGATVKSRDMGITWLASGMSATMCMMFDDMAIGFGSRKLELVDAPGDPKCIFWKVRKFIECSPPEFVGGWSSKEKLISFSNGSTIAGEGGDDIGRGARTGLYFVDEAAKVQHQESVDASLSATSNCRQFLSTPNGAANPFARKVLEWPAHRVFQFNWRDDPRKDDAWYRKQVDELDPVTLAQEVDMDFNASVEGVIIPSAWVQAAIGAHETLDIPPSGERRAALDVADEGADKNAFASAHGILLDRLDEWSGQGSDIFQTVTRAFALADDLGIDSFIYDADGMGAGVRGDARVINEARNQEAERTHKPPRSVGVSPFWGSGAVERPNNKIAPGADRTNGDYYANLKAQSWGALRARFRETYRAVTEPDYKYDPAMLISIDRNLPLLTRLTSELSQPTWGPNTIGKMVVNKKPDGAKSPNLADAVMMVYGAARRSMMIDPEAVRRSAWK